MDESFMDNVKLGNNSSLCVMGKGNIKVEVNGVMHCITEVFYVPELKNNLIGLGQLQEKGMVILIKKNSCHIHHPDKGLIIQADMTSNSMFILKIEAHAKKQMCFKSTTEEESWLWHCRFGHLSFNGLKALQQNNMVKRLPLLQAPSTVCEECMVGKQQRETFPKESNWRATQVLQLVHSDICGPINPISNNSKRYFITFTDDFSRKTWTYFLAEKSEALVTFKKFKASVEKETGVFIKAFRTDKGFTSNEFVNFCEINGIHRQLTAAYSPQQNGVAERKNRTIMNMMRTHAVKDVTPEEAWSDNLRTKLDKKSTKCVMLGVSNESKAYRLYNPKTQKIIISRDVVFDEASGWNWNDQPRKEASVYLEETENEQIVEEGEDEPVEPRFNEVSSNLPSGDELSDDDNIAQFALFVGNDPNTLDDAVKSLKWRKAMDLEIQAIERNNTWELVDLPKGEKTVGVKWILKTKFKENGEIDKHKARLVAKGYTQKYGIDYSEVFAPVVRHDTIRFVISLAAQNDWSIYQLDMKSAFYMESSMNKCTLINPLDMCNKEKKEGNGADMFKDFKKSMMEEFEMTDLGKMHYFLGIEVKQSSNGIFIGQKKYAEKILKRFHMEGCNSVQNPIVPGTKLVKDEGGEKVDNTYFKQIVGSLMYLTATRPDLMFTVNLICRYMESPTELHFQATKRVLRYLKGTTDLGLFYKKKTGAKLMGFSDSDYAGDLNDRKSTSGYVFLLSSATVAWSSRKQPVVTLSTTEAEFIAAASCACQAVWLRRILEELDFIQEKPAVIICDNSSTIKLSKNPVMHGRSKHIDVRFHFLRYLARDEVIKLEHCPSNMQVADILIKPLKLEAYIRMREALGICSSSSLN
ncbi:unnamed protein product [Prunus armeniaca]